MMLDPDQPHKRSPFAHDEDAYDMPTQEMGPIPRIGFLIEDSERLIGLLSSDRLPDYARDELTLTAEAIANPANDIELLLPEAIEDLCLTRSISKIEVHSYISKYQPIAAISILFTFDNENETAGVSHGPSQYDTDLALALPSSVFYNDTQNEAKDTQNTLMVSREEIVRCIASLTLASEYADSPKALELDIEDPETVRDIVEALKEKADSFLAQHRYSIGDPDSPTGYIEHDIKEGSTCNIVIGQTFNSEAVKHSETGDFIRIDSGQVLLIGIGEGFNIEASLYMQTGAVGAQKNKEIEITSDEGQQQVRVVQRFVNDQLTVLDEGIQPEIVPLDDDPASRDEEH